MKNKKTLTYIIGGSLGIIILVAAIVIAYLMSPANVYARYIASAEKYLEAGDYSKAILAYQDAIEQDPQNVEAYAGLAQVYIDQNDTENAMDLLKRGVARTDSPRLRLMLNKLIKDESSADGSNSSGAIKTDEALYLDTGTLEIIGSYSYADYSSRYGLEDKQGNRDGSVTCTFKGLDAELLFANTVSQPDVVSATTVNANAIPASVTFRNALHLFGTEDSVSYQTLETLNLTNLHIIDHSEWNKAVQFEEKNVRITIQSDANGNISAGAANELIPLRSEEVSDQAGNVLATGTVKDAQTGIGVASVNLYVREGMYQSGPTVEEVTSNGSGIYEFHVGPGEYTIEISANGYTTNYVTIYIGSYETTHVQDLVISKQLASGEARIVLTWSSSPSDLDSYLSGTLDDGTQVLTGWASRQSGNKAELDLDDTDGFGPETTTIYDLNGKYQFYVLDFTGSGRMNSSGATVTVYLPGQAAQTITINGGISGTVWCVLEIDHGVLNIVNNASAFGIAEGTTSMYH